MGITNLVTVGDLQAIGGASQVKSYRIISLSAGHIPLVKSGHKNSLMNY